MEIWKDLTGYIGIYQVSNNGRIKSLSRKIVRKNGQIAIVKEKILKSKKDRYGYFFIVLSNNNIRKTILVHRLVAAAFIPNPENKPCIDHIDGNRTNNHADNLRWVTAKENSNNYNAPNTYKGKKINKGGKAVLQYDLEGNFIKEWVTTMEIQRQLNYHRSNISNCCNGLVKTAYNYIWRYKNE